MSRLLQAHSEVSTHCARHEWVVTGQGALEPAELVARLGAMAAQLVRTVIDQAVVPSDLERLELLEPVSPGERLVATAALERATADRWPVSVVVRRRARTTSEVVVVGVLVFVPERRQQATARAAQPGRARSGHSPVSTSFYARAADRDWLISGNLLAWVHASALLSAQGAAAVPLRSRGLEAVSLSGRIAPGELLRLDCSVLPGRGDDELRVYGELRGDGDREPVLRAVSRFTRA